MVKGQKLSSERLWDFSLRWWKCSNIDCSDGFPYLWINLKTLNFTFQIFSLLKEILWTKSSRTADLNYCEPCKTWLQAFRPAVVRSTKQWQLIDVIFQGGVSVFSFLNFSVNTDQPSRELRVTFWHQVCPQYTFLIWRKDLSSLNLSFLLKNKRAEFRDLSYPF